MLLLDRTKIHNGLSLNFGTDTFVFEIPQGEHYENAVVDSVSNVRGGAAIESEPAQGATGNGMIIKIRWWYNAVYPPVRTTSFKYRIKAFSINTETLRIKNLMQNITFGNFGVYLKEVGGDMLVSYNAEFRFEPASSLKILHLFHSMLEVKNGNAEYSEMLSVPAGGWCRIRDDNGPYTRMTLEEAMRRMMKNSDNECTEAIRRRFGKYSLMQTAQTLNMSSTLLVHGIGCGWSEEMGGHNYTTLHDLGLIYEKTANGSVFTDAERNKLISLMADGIYSEWLAIAQEEGESLGLPQTIIDDFKSKLYIYNKGGEYSGSAPLPGMGNINGEEREISIFGVLRVQVKDASGSLSFKHYCYGVFVSSLRPEGENSIHKADSARFQGNKELVRKLFTDSLRTHL